MATDLKPGMRVRVKNSGIITTVIGVGDDDEEPEVFVEAEGLAFDVYWLDELEPIPEEVKP